jgi:predicted nucleotidyltransferase
LKVNRTKILRNRVAQEAALLLYTSQEKEYKQAKQRAAEILRARVLPSNLEVAVELDKIAEDKEGPQRKELLLRMRQEAKQIMQILAQFSPRLVGSVWRGTARQNSDVDIHIFFENHQQIVEELQTHNYKVKSSERRSVTKEGKKESNVHVQVLLQSGDIAEVVVRSPDCIGQQEKCETYGDIKSGLSLNQLTKVLEDNPLQKFVPA